MMSYDTRIYQNKYKRMGSKIVFITRNVISTLIYLYPIDGLVVCYWCSSIIIIQMIVCDATSVIPVTVFPSAE